MDLVTGIATYIIIWWIFFFMVLPWGNHVPPKIALGFERGAPEKPRLLLKISITSLLAGILCLIIHITLRKGWVDLKAFFS